MDERRAALERLRILELIEAALGRRDEVFAIVEDAADPDEAEVRVRELFDVEEAHLARAVLDVQVRRWTRSERERTRAEIAEVRALLEGRLGPAGGATRPGVRGDSRNRGDGEDS